MASEAFAGTLWKYFEQKNSLCNIFKIFRVRKHVIHIDMIEFHMESISSECNDIENNFRAHFVFFYASSHPSNAMEPTKALGPDKSAKSNPSPPPETDIWAPFFEESFKNRHFNCLEAQKIVNWTVIGVVDDAESEKHNENLAGVKECTGRDEAPSPENGAHEEH